MPHTRQGVLELAPPSLTRFRPLHPWVLKARSRGPDGDHLGMGADVPRHEPLRLRGPPGPLRHHPGRVPAHARQRETRVGAELEPLPVVDRVSTGAQILPRPSNRSFVGNRITIK